MRFVHSIFLTLPAILPLAAQARPEPAGLRYRIQLWYRDEPQPAETRFTVQTLPPERSMNRVQKPRFVPWELRAEREDGSPGQQVMLMSWARRLLFLSGPTVEAHPEPIRLSFHGKALPVWSLAVPKNLDASAVLVEVEPRLLALCDLSARFTDGDVARLELHLEEAGPLLAPQPAEEGTALLSALLRWSRGQD